MSTRKRKILVVDDQAEMRFSLQSNLEEEYDVLTAENGERALSLARSSQPDLILLDVTMPGLDGYETCRRLKADGATRDIPVLFVTAQSETLHKVEGLEMGASDYITKPFQFPELLARIHAFLRIKSLQDELRETNASLARALEQLNDLMAFQRDMMGFIVHDLKGPITALTGNLQLLSKNLTVVEPAKQVEWISSALLQGKRLLDMSTDILEVARMEEKKLDLQKEGVDAGPLVQSCLLEAEALAEGKNLRFVSDVNGPARVHADPHLLARILMNLLQNAAKHGPAGSEVRLRTRRSAQGLEFRVEDQGPGISPEIKDKIFDKFVQATGEGKRRRGTGLGLTFCKLAVEAHGGTIGMDSAPGQGTTFYFTIPD